jgi:hypothetical protein
VYLGDDLEIVLVCTHGVHEHEVVPLGHENDESLEVR